MRLHHPWISFHDKQTVEGWAGHWWRTWATSGPAAPTPSSPLRWWGPLVCSSEWHLWFLGYQDNGGDLETVGYLTGLERTEDGGEDRGQFGLCSASGWRTILCQHQQPCGYSASQRATLLCAPPWWRSMKGWWHRVGKLWQEWSSDGQTGHRSYSACWPAWGHCLGQQHSSLVIGNWLQALPDGCVCVSQVRECSVCIS